MARPVINAARDAEIVRRAADGEPQAALAREFDLHPRRIWQILDTARERRGEKRTAYAADRRRRAALTAAMDQARRHRRAAAAPKTADAPAKPLPFAQLDPDAFLAHAVARECAPAWVRHPQPTT